MANYPFSENPEAELPESAEVGGPSAQILPDRRWILGPERRVVVMGLYYAHVYSSVLAYLDTARKNDLSAAERDLLAHEFAATYSKATDANADMIEETIRKERFDCDYQRNGCVQASDADHQETPQERSDS
ncbi:MAG: hypothetical protein EXQ58_06250 [Acidobacteria bacterium]|nr:hypothetical protein [Acidobacteriota bacterium]